MMTSARRPVSAALLVAQSDSERGGEICWAVADEAGREGL
jgi:hypothetical protein